MQSQSFQKTSIFSTKRSNHLILRHFFLTAGGLKVFALCASLFICYNISSNPATMLKRFLCNFFSPIPQLIFSLKILRICHLRIVMRKGIIILFICLLTEQSYCSHLIIRVIRFLCHIPCFIVNRFGPRNIL